MVNPKAETPLKADVSEIRRTLSCGNPGCRCQSHGDARYHCPAHSGEGATLSITEKDGRPLVHCFAGCEGKDVINALRERKLWPETQAKQKQTQTAVYDYRGLNGESRFQVVRYDYPKTFKQRQPDGRGGWQWNMKDVVRIPYRLPELASADPVNIVYIPEGEKDVDRLWALGQVATCNPMGAGKWQKGYSAYLEGRHVVVLPDNDGPGLDHAEKVARITQPLAASLKVINLPGLPDHGDLFDWLDAGHTLGELTELVEAAPIWLPEVLTTEYLVAEGSFSTNGKHSNGDDPAHFSLTDTGNAELFAYMHGDGLRYDHRRSHWLQWANHWWNDD